MEPSRLRYTNRWIAYFDLLGFSNLVREQEIGFVLPLYKEVLATIEEKARPTRRYGISYSWFSDTFIIYSKRDSDSDFALIEHTARLFFQKLIMNQIPVRGALSVGPLYTQQKENIFLGPALIEAYEYGEKQNWLGFILTPSVFKHLENSTLNLSYRPFYRQIDDSNIIRQDIQEGVYAFAFNNGEVNGRNPYLHALTSMKAIAGQQFAEKYDNAINFINCHAWPKQVNA